MKILITGGAGFVASSIANGELRKEPAHKSGLK